MGKCIKCGEETYNRYQFEIGEDIPGSHDYSQFGNEITHSWKYKILEKYTKYACSKCIIKNHIIEYIIMAILFTGIGVVTLFFAISLFHAANNATYYAAAIIGSVILSLISILSFFLLYRNIRFFYKDNYINNDSFIVCFDNDLVGSRFVLDQCRNEVRKKYPSEDIYNCRNYKPP